VEERTYVKGLTLRDVIFVSSTEMASKENCPKGGFWRRWGVDSSSGLKGVHNDFNGLQKPTGGRCGYVNLGGENVVWSTEKRNRAQKVISHEKQSRGVRPCWGKR